MNNPSNSHGHRFPSEIISHTVWLYHRFTLSFRDIEDLLAERGNIVSYETIREWCLKFGPEYTGKLRKRQGRLGDTWLMDGVVIVTVPGERRYLWRAVDQDTNVIDILVKMLKRQGRSPRPMITDKLKSYSAARREIMSSVVHCQYRYANNRGEASHQHIRQHERQMRRFKSPGQAQRFLSVEAQIYSLFRIGRHLLRARHYQAFRLRALCAWQEETCVC